MLTPGAGVPGGIAEPRMQGGQVGTCVPKEDDQPPSAVPMHALRPHPIRLNREFRADLAWWRLFTPSWNGISFLPPPCHLPTLELTTDASG